MALVGERAAGEAARAQKRGARCWRAVRPDTSAAGRPCLRLAVDIFIERCAFVRLKPGLSWFIFIRKQANERSVVFDVQMGFLSLLQHVWEFNVADSSCSIVYESMQYSL